MTKPIIVRQCSHIGIAGTTPVHVKQHESGAFEARCGFAVMGATNMDEAGFKACNYDPFHEKFHDNYAVGLGDTEESAIEALKLDMKTTADILWSF
jgi:hypothetical protein